MNINIPGKDIITMNQKNFQKRGLLLPMLLTLFLLFCVSLCFWLGLLVFLTGCRNTKEIAPETGITDAAANSSSLQTAVAEQVLRLHIVADSNSDADQTVKLAVRDAVLTYLEPYLGDVTTKQDAMAVIEAKLPELAETANRILAENGFSYTADVSLGRTYFPIKVYGDLTLPAGEYDALKICLGSAAGKNWWCLVFPQLCFVDITTGKLPESSKEELRALLTEEEYALIFPEEFSGEESLPAEFSAESLFTKDSVSESVAASVALSEQSCRILFDSAPRKARHPNIRFPLLNELKKLFSGA